MKFRQSLLSLIAGACFSLNTFADLPENYQTLSNVQKQEILWQNIETSHNNHPLPKLKENGFSDAYNALCGLFNLAPTFDYFSDEVPENRKKIIHANGSSAKVSFSAVSGHPFTGIYHSGAIGIARLSLATTPSDTSFIPGMAIKFLLTDNASLNLHVMNDLSGQADNWNFFAKTFSNKIEHPTSWILLAIEKIFSWTFSPPNDLPIAALSQLDGEGHMVNEPIAPTRIYFKASENVANTIEPASREDFRLSLLEINVGPLYEVYGELDGVEYHIGTLMLDSQLLASNYGDKNLFFQHRRK